MLLTVAVDAAHALLEAHRVPWDIVVRSSHIGGQFDGTAHRGDHQCDLDSRIGSLESPQKDSNCKQRVERMKGANPSDGDHRGGTDTPSCSWMGVRVFGCDAHTMVQIPAHVIPDAPDLVDQIGPVPQKEKKPRH